MPHCRVRQPYLHRIEILLFATFVWIVLTQPSVATAGVPAVGACCDRAAGTCADGVEESACPESGINWVEGAACDPDPFSIPCGISACCTPDDTCVNLTEEECLAVPPLYKPRLWDGGKLCALGGQVCPNSLCIGQTGSCTEPHDRFCDGGLNDGQLCTFDGNCRRQCVSNVCYPDGGACATSADCNDDGQCVIGPGGMPACEGGARDGESCNPDRGDRDCWEAFCRLFPGCEVPVCCTAVCEYSPGFPIFTEFCCQIEWDEQCAELAREVCTGACCVEDPVEAVCTDGLNSYECSTLPGTLFLDQSCSELDVAGGCPGLGACCDRSVPGGQCTSRVPESQCDAANPQIAWYEGQDCVEDGGTVDCPEHTGACCDRSVPGGSCESGVPESQCQTSDPQVLWFKEEDCVEDGGTIECLEHTGACCDGNTGTCADDVPESQCDRSDPQFTWFKATACDALDPPCQQHRGACCNRIAGVCSDDVLPDDCRNVNPGDQLTWFKSTPCSEVDCTEAVGACCDRSAGPLAETGLCTNGLPFADCQCPTCEWSKARTCNEITSEGSCEADFAAIPAVTEWGLVILTLLLLTAAKVHGYWRTTSLGTR